MTVRHRIASIDLGTNTALLLIGEAFADGQVVEVFQAQEIVQLGEGLGASGVFSQAAMDRTGNALERFAQHCRDWGVKRIRAVATSASRDAANSAQFYEVVKARTGLHFEILSGDEEARLSFSGGLLPGYKPTETLVLDIGGGSTEFVSEQGGVSIDVGSVRATEWGLSGAERRMRIRSLFEQGWAPIPDLMRVSRARPHWIGVAGTVTTLAALAQGLVSFDEGKIHGSALSRRDLSSLASLLGSKSEEHWRAHPLIGKRAKVLPAGLEILEEALIWGQKDGILVSCHGLRFGVLRDLAKNLAGEKWQFS